MRATYYLTNSDKTQIIDKMDVLYGDHSTDTPRQTAVQNWKAQIRSGCCLMFELKVEQMELDADA